VADAKYPGSLPHLTGNDLTRESLTNALQDQGATNVDALVEQVFAARSAAAKTTPGDEMDWWALVHSAKWALAGPGE
jgi:hypothetical protein